MNIDLVQRNRDLRRFGKPSSFNGFFWAAFVLLLAAVTYIYYWEAANGQSDIHLHGNIAAGFNFLDPHSITSRIAYPLWHLQFAILYQLGVPFSWAAALVCILYKMLGFMLAQRIIALYLAPEATAKTATVAALLLMFVTPIRIPSVNPNVYIGIGSPTVWHNPTQILAIFTSLLCVPYTAHCVHLFRQQRAANRQAAVALSWKTVATLAALLLLSVLGKPTFMQAFLPACAVFFAVLWIRNPKQTRYFLQILLAFLPAALYFLMQYLYYTGVVVPFTSGVAVSLDMQRFLTAIRNMLMMAAFPLLTLLLTYKKGALRDPVLALCLLITAVSVLEAALFYETGLRENHGNFNWASMNAAFLLWLIALPRFVNAVLQYRAERQTLRATANRGAVASADLARMQTWLRIRSTGFLVAIVLLCWHLYAAILYLRHLFATGNVF